ncbi:MAG: hypothetical protein A3F17_03790 [Gammaproteobacteria bacterium RIFCSPHIGHO2_12_FULL_41_15]|nr:MAG: hypothetical protein A3F17_03790 [Gammaproteobacteria bacterium RIFCSPHIGHO2_12_FULL_41_15]
MASLLDLNLQERNSKNLGTFNNLYLDSTAKAIFSHYSCANGNDHYTQKEINQWRDFCGKYLLTLCHADKCDDFQFHTASGSSEAVYLGLLTLKRHFQESHPGCTRLNIIVPTNAHVCWRKAADFLDLEIKHLPIDLETMSLNPEQAINLIDENTIGICATLGTPTTLLFDPVQHLNNLLETYFQKTGHFVPIHVDAASGGFVAPFVFPELVWDFRLRQVYSINISSHKYGMVYPALGWLLTRNLSCLKKMTHGNDYLGSYMQRISLQFSYSAAHVVTQYHQLATHGHQGYQEKTTLLYSLGDRLKQALQQCPELEVYSWPGYHLPGIVFSAKNEQFHLSVLADNLKKRGWYLPVYHLPDPLATKKVARIVIRHGFSVPHIQQLIADIAKVLAVDAIC